MKASELRQIRLIALQRGAPGAALASVLARHSGKDLTPELLASIGREVERDAPKPPKQAR